MPSPYGSTDSLPVDPQDALCALLKREAHYPPFEFILRYGRPYEPAERPSELPRGKQRCCFANAFQLASEDPALKYVEGFASPSDCEPIAMRHGWCADESGALVDPTWGHHPLPSAYRGVVLPLDFVEPYVEDYSRGVFDALADRIDLVAERIAIS